MLDPIFAMQIAVRYCMLGSKETGLDPVVELGRIQRRNLLSGRWIALQNNLRIQFKIILILKGVISCCQFSADLPRQYMVCAKGILFGQFEWVLSVLIH